MRHHANLIRALIGNIKARGHIPLVQADGNIRKLL